MNKKIFALFLIPLLTVAVLGIARQPELQNKAVAQAPPITINFVHGIPNPDAQNLDICIRANAGDFQKVVNRFSFSDVGAEVVSQQVNGQPLLPGNYDIVVVRPGDACNTPYGGLEINGLDIADGDNVSIIAHLIEDGSQFTLSGGFNDVSRTSTAVSSLITVYHAAALPRSDFRVGRAYPVRELFTFIANGEFGDSEIRPGSYQLTLVPAGASPTDGFLQEEQFPITPDANNVIYVVGSLADGSLVIKWQDIPLGDGGGGTLQ